MLYGPPGAGKTTEALRSGLEVFDRDAAPWSGDEAGFRSALRRLAETPSSRAVVIRSGATSQARAKVARLVRPTHQFMVMVDQATATARVASRERHDRRQVLAGIPKWFADLDRDDGVPDFPGWAQIAEISPDLGSRSRSW